MYKDLIQSIKSAIENVKAIEIVYPNPLKDGEKIKKYPAVVFFPDAVSNSFETTRDNKKDFTFKIYVIVNCNNDTMANIFTNTLPNAVDKVMEQFDENWEVSVTGASVSSWVIDSGNWSVSSSDAGFEAVAELNLRVRMLVGV